MTGNQEMTVPGRFSRWRIAGWSFAALILLVPLAAMQFGAGFNWSAADFIFFGVMVGGVGLLFELAVRVSPRPSFRAGIAVALLAAFLTIWVNAAVGMIGDDNSYNLLFGGVLLIALVGSFFVRFKAQGMMWVMLVAGVAQAAAAAGGMAQDPLGATLSLWFTVPWLLAAGLFKLAAGSPAAQA